MSLPSPAVNIPCSNSELRDVVYQVNRRFQDIEQLLGSVAVDATIPDRSLANVKLILGTITDAEIANVTITAGKLNIISLSEITKAAGTLTSGKLQGFTIESSTITSPTISTPTVTGGSWAGGTFTTGNFTGTAIITGAGSEIGPFNVTAAKLYSGLVEHNATQSYYGTGNDIAILDSTDGTYRLTVGNASYGSAPFRVTKAGVMTAVGPTITGATISTPTITGGSITSASISNSSVSATTLSVDANSSVNIAAGTEIIFAGDTQLFRSSAGNLKTDGNFTAVNLLLDAGSGIGTLSYSNSLGFYTNNVKMTLGTGDISGGAATFTNNSTFGSNLTVSGTLTANKLVSNSTVRTASGVDWDLSSPNAGSFVFDTKNSVIVGINGTSYRLACAI